MISFPELHRSLGGIAGLFIQGSLARGHAETEEVLESSQSLFPVTVQFQSLTLDVLSASTHQLVALFRIVLGTKAEVRHPDPEPDELEREMGRQPQLLADGRSSPGVLAKDLVKTAPGGFEEHRSRNSTKSEHHALIAYAGQIPGDFSCR